MLVSKEMGFFVIVAIAVVLFNRFLLSGVYDLTREMLPYEIRNMFIYPLLSGLAPMWIIIARGVTSSKLGGSITCLVKAIIDFGLFIVLDFLLAGLLYGLLAPLGYEQSSLAEYYSSEYGLMGLLVLSARDFILTLTLGLVIDGVFGVYTFIRGNIPDNQFVSILVFPTAGGASAFLVRSTSFFINLMNYLIFDIGSGVDDFGNIVLQQLSGTVGGILIGGGLGFLVSFVIVQAGILPYTPSTPLHGSTNEGVQPTRKASGIYSPKATIVSSPATGIRTAAKKSAVPVTKRSEKITSESSIDRLKRFRNAISRSKNIPFTIAVDVLGFGNENDFISWLWEIDLPGFEIDYETKMVKVVGKEEDVVGAIDKLLDQYERMEDGKSGKI